MSYKLELDQQWRFCPIEWRNFISSLPHEGENGVSSSIINEALSPFACIYTELGSDNDPCIEFNDESDLLMFKLKYSN